MLSIRAVTGAAAAAAEALPLHSSGLSLYRRVMRTFHISEYLFCILLYKYPVHMWVCDYVAGVHHSVVHTYTPLLDIHTLEVYIVRFGGSPIGFFGTRHYTTHSSLAHDSGIRYKIWKKWANKRPLIIKYSFMVNGKIMHQTRMKHTITI